jgi:hypothetical protein
MLAHPDRDKENASESNDDGVMTPPKPCISNKQKKRIAREKQHKERYEEVMELYVCALETAMEGDDETQHALEKIDGVCRRKEVRVTEEEQETLDALNQYHDEQGHPSAVELLNRLKNTDRNDWPQPLRNTRWKSVRWLASKLVCASCASCAQRATPKSKRTVVDVMERKKKAEQANTLHLVADLCGPHHVEHHTVGGAGALHMEEQLINKNNKWTLVVVEENALVGYTAHFDKKSDAKIHVQDAVRWFQAVMEKPVVEIIVDNGTEFKGAIDADGTMKDYLRTSGIHMRYTIAHEKVKNSLAERYIDIVITKARVLLSRARLPTWLHAYATSYAMHMLNHAQRAAAGGVAPMHYMSNASGIEKERDLVMFGERISMLNNKSDRANKFAEVSAHAIYLGIDRNTGAYVALVPASNDQQRPYLVTGINLRRTRRFYYSYYAHELAFAPRFGVPQIRNDAFRPSTTKADATVPLTLPSVPSSSSEKGVKKNEVIPAANEKKNEVIPAANERRVRIYKQQQAPKQQAPSRSSARQAGKERVDYRETASKAQKEHSRYALTEVVRNGSSSSSTTTRDNDPAEVAFPDNGGKAAFFDDDNQPHYEIEHMRPSPTRLGYQRLKWVDYEGEFDVPNELIDSNTIEEDGVKVNGVKVSAASTARHIEETGRHLHADGTLNVCSVLWEAKAIAMLREESIIASTNNKEHTAAHHHMAKAINLLVSSITAHEEADDNEFNEERVALVPVDGVKYKEGQLLLQGAIYNVSSIEHYAESDTAPSHPPWSHQQALNKKSVVSYEFALSKESGVKVSAIVKTDDGVDRVLMEPQTVKEMLGHAMYEECMAACRKEYASLVENETWRLVRASSLPRGVRPIKCKWVWKFKVNADGNIDKVKARLCARGDMQQEGVDYNETFATTVKTKTIKVAALLAVVYGLDLRQIDYTNAFLNGYVKERIFMEQVPLFVLPPENGQERPAVLELVKSLYGIKQAPRVWNKMIDAFMQRMHFTPLTADPGMYVRMSRTGKPIIITLYVDDKMIMVAPEDKGEWGEIEKEIANTFKITSEEKCEWILRVSVQHHTVQRVLSLSQQRYVEEMFTTYKTEVQQWGARGRVLNPAGIQPLVATGERVKEDVRHSRSGRRKQSSDNAGEDEKQEEDARIIEDERPLTAVEQKLYQSIVGSLMYAANITRIDVCFITNALARYMAAARVQHMRAAVRVLQYLHETKKRCIRFQQRDEQGTAVQGSGGGTALNIVVYSDSDWASCLDSRRSTSGVVVTINGLPILWTSKRQKTVALSSCEAEYMAMAEAAKEALWLRHLLTQLQVLSSGYVLVNPLLVMKVDNSSAVQLSADTGINNKSKHIAIRYHFLKEMVSSGELRVDWIATQYQLADILTKRLDRDTFDRIRDHLLAAEPAATPTTYTQFEEAAAMSAAAKKKEKQRNTTCVSHVNMRTDIGDHSLIRAMGCV